MQSRLKVSFSNLRGVLSVFSIIIYYNSSYTYAKGVDLDQVHTVC